VSVCLLLFMTYFKQLIAAAFLMVVIYGQVCPSQTIAGGILSGNRFHNLDSLTFGVGSNVTLQNGTSVQCYNYTFQTPFSSTYQVAVGIFYINPATTAFEGAASNNFAYYVRPYSSNSLNSISFQVRTPWSLNQWTKLSIRFMAENRNDIELGSRIIDSSFVGGCGPKSQIMSFNFERNWAVTPTLVVRVFLSGISETTTAGSTLELRMSTATANSQGATFNLTINGASFIDLYYIGYLLYDPNNFGIQAVDGLFERVAVFNALTQQLPNNRINSYTYSLYGLSGYEFNAMYPLSFNVAVDNNLLMTVGSNNQLQSYFAVGYFLAQGSCSTCPNFPYLSGVNCVQTCQQGLPQNGICPNVSSCPINSIWNGTTCICNSGWFNISGACQQCPSGTTYNGIQCVNVAPVCPQNSNFNYTINQCQCNSGLFNISGVCQQCPYGAYFNGLICVQSGTTCPLNSAYNSNTGQCQCNSGLYNISGVCQQCPPGTQWNGQTCAQFGVPCGQNSVYNVTINMCQCLSNFYNISGVCQQCPANSQWNGQQCIQIIAPVNPSGPNITCPGGTNCVLLCSNYPNVVYSSALNQCICATNTYFISGYCQSCPQGWTFNGATCVQPVQTCPLNSVLNGNTCVCVNGYIQYPSGCVSSVVPPGPVSCADGMYYNSRNKKCVLCPNGCASCTNGNTCKKCSPGYSVQNGQCNEICGDGIRFVLPCDDGNRRDGDGCSSQCQI
jgi:cysteine-rich repeat protein